MIIAMDHLVQSEVYNKLDKEFLNLSKVNQIELSV